jgi:hypothetical protein
MDDDISMPVWSRELIDKVDANIFRTLKPA